MSDRARLARLPIDYVSAGADFDEDRIYRYTLHRAWPTRSGSNRKMLLWVMLNPSTADEHVLDPTLRRVESFTRTFRFDGFEVVNLFAYRATDPDAMWKESICGMDVVGPGNDDHIIAAANRASKIVVAWGRVFRGAQRARSVLSFFSQHHLSCLGRNNDGSPKHPLYLVGSTTLEDYP